jgi:protein-S-isoprenylcysteine O-methyltransferase Ste14
MRMIARHLLSIAILPFTVTVLVPMWLYEPQTPWLPEQMRSRPELALAFAGLGVLLIGMILFAASLRRFATEGKGTLAPWDPPREFVVTGPYRYVRNPMISGVILILFGEAMVLQTRWQALWALAFLAGNLVQIPLMEEPILRAKFGPAYHEYCRHVRRFIPRFTPWRPGGG